MGCVFPWRHLLGNQGPMESCVYLASPRCSANAGDPLLVVRGVTEVDSDAVYFFRLGKHGFIKSIQRIPRGTQ